METFATDEVTEESDLDINASEKKVTPPSRKSRKTNNIDRIQKALHDENYEEDDNDDLNRSDEFDSSKDEELGMVGDNSIFEDDSDVISNIREDRVGSDELEEKDGDYQLPSKRNSNLHESASFRDMEFESEEMRKYISYRMPEQKQLSSLDDLTYRSSNIFPDWITSHAEWKGNKQVLS